MVGGADGVFVVLDDNDGVAEVAQVAQRFDELFVVGLVQADARFVEHVEHAGESGAELGGEADALALAAGEGAAFAMQSQVAQADLVRGNSSRLRISLTSSVAKPSVVLVRTTPSIHSKCFGDRQGW